MRAFVATYGMPALITNCSNNYGAYQHPEKLIPLMIIHALEGKPLPVYGDGSNVRDWLHVSDHCDALMNVIERGRTGETYNVGGGNERNNREVVGLICDTIDRAFAADSRLASRFPSCPAAAGGSCRTLITYVTDRPGHDHRYAIDADETCDRTRQPLQRRFRKRACGRPCSWYLDQKHGGATSPAAPTRRGSTRITVSGSRSRPSMRILVLNADYPRFLSWLYRRQRGARERWLRGPDGGAKRQPVRRRRFLFAEFFRARPSGGGDPRQQCLAADGVGARARDGRRSRRARPLPQRQPNALPAWLQRAVTPLKPMLRPLARKVGLSPRLDAQAENILLAQIEDFKPDLVLNQDTFHVDTRLMRRIKEIGNPILIGQIGIAPSRGEDWSVYDLMMSQLSRDGRFFPAPRRARGSQPSRVRAGHSRCAAARLLRRISMCRLSAPCRRITSSGLRCSRRLPNVTI